MKYFILVLILVLTLLFHWHYYRWCIFNEPFNRPLLYRSPKGDLLVYGSKILLFVSIIFIVSWYYIFLPIVIFHFMKMIAFNQELELKAKYYLNEDSHTKGRISKVQAVKLAKDEMDKYNG